MNDYTLGVLWGLLAGILVCVIVIYFSIILLTAFASRIRYLNGEIAYLKEEVKVIKKHADDLFSIIVKEK